jgi:hypothetical protein
MVLLCMELMTIMIIRDAYCLAEVLVQDYKQDRSNSSSAIKLNTKHANHAIVEDFFNPIFLFNFDH